MLPLILASVPKLPELSVSPALKKKRFLFIRTLPKGERQEGEKEEREGESGREREEGEGGGKEGGRED